MKNSWSWFQVHDEYCSDFDGNDVDGPTLALPYSEHRERGDMFMSYPHKYAV